MDKKSRTEKAFLKAKNKMNDTTNYISINIPKTTITKLSNSVNSNQKILFPDNSILNNNSNITNSLIKLSFKNNDFNINSFKEKNSKEKKNISKSYTRNKKLTKINIKKNKNKSQNFPNFQNDKIDKNQQTIFQKIITDLDKVKTKTDKTLEIMKKNLKK